MRKWMNSGPIASGHQSVGRALLSMALVMTSLFANSSASHAAGLESEWTTFRYPKECILNIVASKLNIELDQRIATPSVHLESEVTLQEFQDAVEPWWKIRPESVVNVYTPLSNQIFLTDRQTSYRRGRVIDDSMAHEYVHFLQVHYRNADISGSDDQLEIEAVQIQTWFRENFILIPRDVKEVCGIVIE